MKTHDQDHEPAHEHGPSEPSRATASCQATVELLPWLLNGSLSAAERQPLLAHLAGCESCRDELVETLEAAQIFSQHVPSLALAEHAQGLAPQEIDRERIEAHLAQCPSCREELALIRSGDQLTDLAAARARRSAAPARVRRPWLRLAVAAATTLAVGLVLLRSLGPAPRSETTTPAVAHRITAPAADPQPRQQATASADPSSAVIFADGFESDSSLRWSQPLLQDGFESGDDSNWSHNSG